ncbi:MAG TPA: hypothetical protein VMF05_13150 [Stellaceae bacterium]|nr:hypothetical protein [Stellaceae bacterium]
MRQTTPAGRWLDAVAGLLLVALCGCVPRPTVASVSIPPIPAGDGRVWVYRDYEPSESLNMTAVTMNGAYVGYSQVGGAFYRDVRPGVYHVAVNSYGTDFNQSTDIAVVPGEQVYIKIESLSDWATDYGRGFTAARDTFYARLVPIGLARFEIAQSFYDGGS